MSNIGINIKQIAQKQYDEVNEAQRVVIVDANSFEVDLHRTDDSIEAFPSQAISTGTQTSSAVLNSVLITADCNGFKQFCLYSEGLTGVTVAGSIKVQVSPYTSGTSFVNASVTLTSGTAGNMTLTAVSNICARRIRVLSNVAPTGGSVTYTLVLNG